MKNLILGLKKRKVRGFLNFYTSEGSVGFLLVMSHFQAQLSVTPRMPQSGSG